MIPSTRTRADILEELKRITKQSEDQEQRGVGTALQRQARWQNHNPGRKPAALAIAGSSTSSSIIAAGNVKNAAEIAKVRASQVRFRVYGILKHKSDIFLRSCKRNA